MVAAVDASVEIPELVGFGVPSADVAVMVVWVVPLVVPALVSNT